MSKNHNINKAHENCKFIKNNDYLLLIVCKLLLLTLPLNLYVIRVDRQ